MSANDQDPGDQLNPPNSVDPDAARHASFVTALFVTALTDEPPAGFTAEDVRNEGRRAAGRSRDRRARQREHWRSGLVAAAVVLLVAGGIAGLVKFAGGSEDSTASFPSSSSSSASSESSSSAGSSSAGSSENVPAASADMVRSAAAADSVMSSKNAAPPAAPSAAAAGAVGGGTTAEPDPMSSAATASSEMSSATSTTALSSAMSSAESLSSASASAPASGPVRASSDISTACDGASIIRTLVAELGAKAARPAAGAGPCDVRGSIDQVISFSVSQSPAGACRLARPVCTPIAGSADAYELDDDRSVVVFVYRSGNVLTLITSDRTFTGHGLAEAGRSALAAG